MKPRFLIISPKNRTTYNFRGDLICELQDRGYEVVVTGPNCDDIEGVEALGVRFVEVPMDKTGTSVKGDLAYKNALELLMFQEHPMAVLAYTAKPVIYGCMAAKAVGIPNINALITGGGYTLTAKTPKAKALGALVRTLYKAGLGCADHVMFQNPDDQREFVERKLVSESKTSVVNGSGVNMERFQPAPYPEQMTFFVLSRLLKSKGVREYLEAARMVKHKHPQVRFMLLGKYETAMQDAIPREEIEPYIEDGTVERFDEATDVRPYYAQCSVYVLPSYREGLPRTCIEAAAMGRALITTDTNGCREVVDDGVSGFLVPVQDAEALAQAMEFFVEEPQAVSIMGAESLRWCQEKFDVRKVNENMCRSMAIGIKAPFTA